MQQPIREQYVHVHVGEALDNFPLGKFLKIAQSARCQVLMKTLHSKNRICDPQWSQAQLKEQI